MNHLKSSVRCALLLSAGALAAPASLSAQLQPRLAISTTSVVSDADSPIGEIDDGSLTLVGGGAPVRPLFGAGQWLATAGFLPDDVDAFARRPGTAPGTAHSMAFSLLSNEAGFLDGDVLTIAPGGGATVLVSEDEIANALGAPGAALDVDAISFDDLGRLYFSLQADITVPLLGMLEDGDVLRLEHDDTVTLVLSEMQVQAQFSLATGLVGSIGDVQAIEWFGGELWVATQGPSSHDGAVLRAAGVPEVLLEEDQVGLGGAEINAMAFAEPGDEYVTFTLSSETATTGDVLVTEAYGAPFEVLLAMPAGSAAFDGLAQFPGLGGIGGLYVDPTDPWLQIPGFPGGYYFALDGNGRYTGTFQVPPVGLQGTGPGGNGLSLQVLSLSRLELSAPVRLPVQ